MNKLEYAQKLFEDYVSLRSKTQLCVVDVKDLGKIEPPKIGPRDMSKRADLEKELELNFKYLSDESLKELFNDEYFSDLAIKTHVARVNRRG